MFFKQNNDKYPSSFQLKIINYPKIMGNCRVETINVILKLKHFIKSLSSDIENIILNIDTSKYVDVNVAREEYNKNGEN